MSSVKRPTLKNLSLTNEICSLDLITVEKEILEMTEKLDILLAKRDALYEKVKKDIYAKRYPEGVYPSYFC